MYRWWRQSNHRRPITGTAAHRLRSQEQPPPDHVEVPQHLSSAAAQTQLAIWTGSICRLVISSYRGSDEVPHLAVLGPLEAEALHVRIGPAEADLSGLGALRHLHGTMIGDLAPGTIMTIEPEGER